MSRLFYALIGLVLFAQIQATNAFTHVQNSHALTRRSIPHLPVRGITIGPIENSLHSGVGYGTEAYGRTLSRVRDLGATWVALTPFGRIWSTRTNTIDLTFETPFALNRQSILHAIDQAHAHGLRVMLVPHLWVETGGWRGELEPHAPPDVYDSQGQVLVRGRADEEDMLKFASAYRRFVLAWAEVAEQKNVEIFSFGVELRSWVTSGRATFSLKNLIREVRSKFSGSLTYSGNWDDIDDTVVLGEFDLIGINAFYPLTNQTNATFDDMRNGGLSVAAHVRQLAQRWNKPVLFTELGYTARPNAALRPWEWPDHMQGIRVDEETQAMAYQAVLSEVIHEPSFLGFFVWRVFADPEDVSQEAAWGFPIFNKQAEQIVREAFATQWESDRWYPTWQKFGRKPQGHIGLLWQYPNHSPFL